MSLPAWVPAAETKPAPMPLLLVQSFVNTWDGDETADLLADPASGREWLTAAGLWHGPGPPAAADLELAAGVRESIRALLAAHNGGPRPDPGQLDPVRDLAQASALRPVIDPDGLVSLDPPAVAGLGLARLLLVIRDAQQDGSWRRLKACRNPDCRWAFYDRSHSRLGTWCDMAVCGNRIKNRRLRQRHGTPVTG